MTVRVSRVCKAAAPIDKALSRRDRELVDRLIAEAERQGIKIEAGFRETIERIRSRIDLDQLERQIRDGSIDYAQALIDRAVAEAGATPFTMAVRGAFTAGAQIAAEYASELRPGRLDVVWDAVNPRTAAYLREYDMGLIRELSQSVRNVTRSVLAEGIVAGRGPASTAREIRAAVGLTTHQEGIVKNYRRLLESGAHREALTRLTRDRRFDRTLDRAARGERQLTPEQIDRQVERYRERLIKRRGETIARTESIRALNRGNLDTWRQAIEAGHFGSGEVRKQWIYTHDDKVRPWHASIPSMNRGGRLLEEPFETARGPLMHPGDPDGDAANTINCRCTMQIRYVPTLVP